MSFARRAGLSLLALLIALDVLACTLWLAPLYLFKLADRPTGRELISGYVGGAAINGRPWALRLERIINRVFWWQPDHCRTVFRETAGIVAISGRE